jgi:hypothetical protein
LIAGLLIGRLLVARLLVARLLVAPVERGLGEARVPKAGLGKIRFGEARVAKALVAEAGARRRARSGWLREDTVREPVMVCRCRRGRGQLGWGCAAGGMFGAFGRGCDWGG